MKFLWKIACSVVGFILCGQVALADLNSSPIRYQKIVSLFHKLVAGKTLNSDEGSEIKFKIGNMDSQNVYRIGYEHSFPSGGVTHGSETVWTDGAKIFVDQEVDGVIARRYIASIEGPFGVLRIRPELAEDQDIIGRDCLRKNDDEGTICYVKVRYMNDVIVSTYREKNTN
ncbi:MAG: hypothetical protein NTV34_09940 [Proteobacteria bacterium]|nr:hypothetical protein [Pseudomonadota bacterium]